MKTKNIICKFWLSSFAILIFATLTFAAPVVRSGITNDSSDDLDDVINFFRQDLGGTNNGNGNSYINGRREVTWDELPENLCNFPSFNMRKFYNTNVPRGMVLSGNQTYQCSLTPNFSGSSEVARFGNVNSNYVQYFSAYTADRLFAPGTKPDFDIQFFIPGTDTPATVNGFGIIFADKDILEGGIIILYDAKGEVISQHFAQNKNNGMSFIGVSYNDGTRIARVRVFAGNVVLGPDEGVGTGTDVVAIDNIIYGEPRAIGQHSSDFDGDGTSDFSIFRPSNGTWYILNSGSNTYSVAKFGTAGDIPVDGDFDGDSRNDLAVFRPSTGVWYILRSSNGQFQAVSFGLAGDKPVAGDYDQDGITDIAVWRPSDGNYYSLNSSNGQAKIFHFGANGDIPIGGSGQ